MFAIVEHFFVSPPQSQVFLSALAAFVLSAFVGWFLRKNLAEAAPLGFLVISGSANLALIVSLAMRLPTGVFGFLSIALTGAVVALLRKFVISRQAPSDGVDWLYLVAITPPIAAFYLVNIIQPDPSADLASGQIWPVLYVNEAFERGVFFTLDETNIGQGHMASLHYYLDMFGPLALARWMGMTSVYPVYHALSMLAAMLGFSLLAFGLRKNRLAMIAYCLLTLAFLRVDGFYRLLLGYNWSDILIYLGGAQIIYFLTKAQGRRDALIMASLVSVFLVFGRHYGAFFGAVMLVACFTVYFFREADRRMGGWVIGWFVLGGLLVIFSARDLYFLFDPPSQFYPGNSQLAHRRLPLTDSLFFTLNDIGVLENSKPPSTIIGLRGLYIVVFVILLTMHSTKLIRQRHRLMVYLAPFTVFLLPLALQSLTGYRTHEFYNKFFILGIFLPSWYPAFALEQLIRAGTVTRFFNAYRWRLVALGTATIISIAAFAATTDRVRNHRIFQSDMDSYLRWAFQTYKDTNQDMGIAIALKQKYGANIPEVRDRPILYFHYEPGISIRLFLGGKFFQDYDFWSDNVAAQFSDADSLYELIERLGFPNIYLSLGYGQVYGTFFTNGWRKFSQDLENLEQMPWISDITRYKNARFFTVKRPPP